MPRARKEQVSLESTPFYHCMVRCVRRAFLCGKDKDTGKSFDHRKGWIVSRLKQLSTIFSIDICAYAVLSNHYHVVLHVNENQAAQWSEQQVIQRWTALFSCPDIVKRWLANPNLSPAELTVISDIINLWRNRLTDISWFMRCMNETVARQANAEDDCKGRFWEGRFKSQALLDEGALLTCMTYVDLNPIRAGIAKSLEESDFTSIQERLLATAKSKQSKQSKQKTNVLMKFDGSNHTPIHHAIPFTEKDYFELVDWTSRIIRGDKKGYVPQSVPPILQRLNLDNKEFIRQMKYFNQHFTHAVGAIDKLREHAIRIKKKWLKGITISQSLYQPA